jgi:hypothetical protein
VYLGRFKSMFRGLLHFLIEIDYDEILSGKGGNLAVKLFLSIKLVSIGHGE